MSRSFVRRCAGLALLLAATPAAAQQILVNEFFRAGNMGATDEWVEVVLDQPLTATQLEGFFVGDSAGTRLAKVSGYRFTNMGSIAPAFPAGTIIVVSGTTGPAADLSYNPAAGDWNLVLKTTGANLTSNGSTGDLAATDVVYVDTNGTNGDVSMSSQGFAVTWTAPASGAFGLLANVAIGAPANNSGAALTSNRAGASTGANWSISVAAASTTPGQPNGSANTSYILGLRETAPSVSATTPGDNAVGVALAADIGITFSEAVDVTDPWFTISCTSSGTHAAVATGGPTTFTLDPVGDFVNDETCTVTIDALGVSDQDLFDPPNAMAANHVFDFATLSLLPPLTIADVSMSEGDTGTTTFGFVVSLSAPAGPGGVSFNIATSDGSATLADNDYLSASLTGASIAAGASSFAFDVQVNGDALAEGNEAFSVSVDSVVGASVIDGSALGNIQNDDRWAVWQLQGSAACSPFVTPCSSADNTAGPALSVAASVVTAVGPAGYTIQTPDSDADPSLLTSNGIFVFTGSAPTVLVGDRVEIDGTIRERFGSTQIDTVTGTSIVSSGNPLPTPIEFSEAATRPSTVLASLSCPGSGPGGVNNVDTNFECFEGMLVNIVDGIVTKSNQRFGGDDYGEVHVGPRGRRGYREKGVRFPAVPGVNNPDAGQWDGNPEIIELDADALGAFPLLTEIAGGTAFSGQGIIAFDFGDYEFWPVAGQYPVGSGPRFALDTASNVLPRPARARSDAQELTIGSFNAFRLCDIIDDIGQPGGGPNGEIIAFDCDADGIETGGDPAYQLKLDKVSAYIRNVLNSPDVISMQEVEKLVVLQDLATRLGQGGGPPYQAFLVEGNDPGGIDVGFLVRTDRVQGPTVTQMRGTQQWTDPTGGAQPLHDRPPLLLRAQFATSAGGNPLRFAVLAVHNRSFGTEERVHAKRHLQSVAIAEVVDAFQDDVQNARVPLVVAGDFNAYQFTDGSTDPIGVISGTYNDEANGCTPSNGVTTCKLTPAVDPADPDTFQIVAPALVKMTDVLEGTDPDEVYSYAFTENLGAVQGSTGRDQPTSQVIDHFLMTTTAVPLVVDFQYGRGNVDSSVEGFDNGSGPDGLGNSNVPNLAIGSSDHDGYVAFLDTDCDGNPGGDGDGDGVCNVVDNCAAISNAAQADPNGDGLGVACQQAPTFTSSAITTASEDVAYSYAITTADTEGNPLAISAPTLPAWLMLTDNGNGTATLSGTPTKAHLGANPVSLSVTDLDAATTQAFAITVGGVNDAPTISDIADAGTDEDVAAVMNFTIADSDSTLTCSAASLTATSSNPALVPLAGIVFSGTAPSCVATITPQAGGSGAATIGIQVSDGTSSASDQFVLSVNAVNDAPTISAISDASVPQGVSPVTLPFSIGDGDSILDCTTSVTAVSDNQTLVPDANLDIGVGAVVIGPPGCEIRIEPVAGQSGVATITVTVSDGSLSDSSSFTLTVTAPPSAAIFADGFED